MLIKIQRVICTDERVNTLRHGRTGVRFTKGEEYILVHGVGPKMVKIYDDFINAIVFNKPDRCGFGMCYPMYTNYFQNVGDYQIVANKRELRKIVRDNQFAVNDSKLIMIKNPINYATAYHQNKSEGCDIAVAHLNEFLKKKLNKYPFEWEFQIEPDYVFIVINSDVILSKKEYVDLKNDLEKGF